MVAPKDARVSDQAGKANAMIRQIIPIDADKRDGDIPD